MLCKRVKINVYILISVEINMYCVFEKGGNHCVHFERDGSQFALLRWVEINVYL